MKTVGIIGGSGFIGSYVTKKFLAQGFHVKVSVTDISNKVKYEHLKQLPNANQLEIILLRVEHKKQLENFVKDCDVVIHGGTPFQLDVKDVKTELFDPTIKGTEIFLDVVSNTPNIKKVVLIASVAAFNTNFPFPAEGKSIHDTFSESDKPFMSEESHPYAQAKFIANKTVQNFITKHSNLSFEITSVSPVAVMGKSLSEREDSTSIGIQFLFKNKIAPNPFIETVYKNDAEFAMVAVQDVAEGIYKAGTKMGLHGKNYLLSSESYKTSDITLMLNKKEPKNKPRMVYINSLANNDLEMQFKAAKDFLYEFD